MQKIVLILFSTLLIGVIAYFAFPLRFSNRLSSDAFPPEAPVAIMVAEGDKCAEDILFVTKELAGYADVERVNDRCTALQRKLADAAYDGDLSLIRISLSQGANARSRAFSKFGNGSAFLPVINAVWNKKTEAAKILLDNGSDVNSVFDCCMTSESLLMTAVRNEDVSTVKLLLSRDADLFFHSPYKDNEREVFQIAAKKQNPEITALLEDACESSLYDRARCRALPFTWR